MVVHRRQGNRFVLRVNDFADKTENSVGAGRHGHGGLCWIREDDLTGIEGQGLRTKGGFLDRVTECWMGGVVGLNQSKIDGCCNIIAGVVSAWTDVFGCVD